MALTAKSPTLAKAVGNYTELVFGVAGGTGTSTTVTVPQLRAVEGAVVGGATSTTAPYCDTVSTNTFTVTHGSGDLFTYIAFGKPKI